MKKRKVKILMFDIETMPARVWTFDIWKPHISVEQIDKPPFIGMWAAKWYGSSTVFHDTVLRHAKGASGDLSRYEKDIVKSLSKLLEQADIVVTHNGENFDIKWFNGVMIKHKLPPIPPLRSVDTCREASRYSRFLSNSLKFLLRDLELGEKLRTGGFELWVDCLHSIRPAWKRMIRYCINDVTKLQRLYTRMLPYIKNHPNLNLYQDTTRCCPNCGHHRLQSKGHCRTTKGMYRKLVCMSCGKYSRETKNLANKKEIVSAL